MKTKIKLFNRHLIAWVSLVGLGLSGCSSLRPIDHKTAELPKEFSHREPATTSYEVVGRGSFFNDPHLKSLIDQALAHNQELKIMEQRLAQSKAEVKARKGEYLPSVGLIASGDSEKVGEYTRNGAVEQQLSLQEEEFPEPLKNIRVGLSASWELDVWKKLRNKKKSAYHEYLATGEAQRFMSSQLISEIASSYYDLITLDLISNNLQQYNQLQSNAIKTVKSLKQAGKSNELAVKRFEAEFDRNQSKLIQVRQEVIDLENEIRFLIGSPTMEIKRSQDFTHIPSLIPTQTVATQLLLNRPDVKQAEQELLASKLDVKAARAAFFPSIELGASYGREAFKQQLLAHTPEAMFFKLAADLFSPVVNLNEIKANMRIANAKQEQAFLEYERVSLQSYLEVSSQLWRLENLQEQLRLQEDQADALKEANRISGVLFTSARADYLEVLLTQRESLEAQIQWLESQKDLIDANINLYKSLGGGWF